MTTIKIFVAIYFYFPTITLSNVGGGIPLPVLPETIMVLVFFCPIGQKRFAVLAESFSIFFCKTKCQKCFSCSAATYSVWYKVLIWKVL